MQAKRHSEIKGGKQTCSGLECLMLAALFFNVYATDTIAQEGQRDRAGLLQQRCGFEYNTTSQSGLDASLTSLEAGKKLELVIHFPAGSTTIPLDCTSRLGEIAQAVKDGKTGILWLNDINAAPN